MGLLYLLMVLKPKKIEPGWARRWTLQSIDLFRRSPALALSVGLAFVLINVFVPHPLVLNVPAMVFMDGLLFCSLRAADQDSGNAWSATWHYFRLVVRDLAQLARDAFLWMLLISIAVGVFFALYKSATHGLTANHADHALYKALPWWMRQGLLQENGMDLLGIFLPGVLQLVFLTMSVGNQPVAHYNVGVQSVVLNFGGCSVFCLSGMVLCDFLLVAFPDVASPVAGYLLLILYTALFWWFGTWGYLWCREMFDGHTENSKETVRKKAFVFSENSA